MIILAHLLRRESYGYEINKRLQMESGGRFELKEATLYGAFRRLEEAGYVTFYWGDEQTGARRRYYRITPDGMAAFSRLKNEWFEAAQLITGLIDTAAQKEENSDE